MNLAKRIELWPIDRLRPYERNARTHSPEQVTKIAASLAEFGFVNPILVDSNDGIIAGHGRLAAAKELGLKEAPVIVLDHLNEMQRRAYVLADNKLAELAGWDVELLNSELEAIGRADGELLGKIGFSEAELAAFMGDGLFDDDADGDPDADGDGPEYSKKIEAPTYTPKQEAAPDLGKLADETRYRYLVDRILMADIPEDVRDFLIKAAARHVVFDYHNIAEFYCHATADVQRLMEESALVIIDFDKAIDGGYVELSQKMMNIYSESYGDGGDDEDDEE